VPVAVCRLLIGLMLRHYRQTGACNKRSETSYVVFRCAYGLRL